MNQSTLSGQSVTLKSKSINPNMIKFKGGSLKLKGNQSVVEDKVSIQFDEEDT